MRILYTNELVNSSIVASTVDVNFPLGNLFVPALSTPYRSTNSSANIVFEFDAETPINCISLAGHNLTTLRYRVYNISGSIVEDQLVLDLLDTDIFYFNSIQAKKIRVDFTTDDSYASIGAISAGSYIQMPNPVAYYDETLVVTNSRYETKFGQVFGSDGEMLRTFKLDFVYISLAQDTMIKTMLNVVRNFEPIFVDMTESDHDYKMPLYATINGESFSSSRHSRGVQKRQLSLNVREAK